MTLSCPSVVSQSQGRVQSVNSPQAREREPCVLHPEPNFNSQSPEEKRPHVCIGSCTRHWEELVLNRAWKSQLIPQPGQPC